MAKAIPKAAKKTAPVTKQNTVKKAATAKKHAAKKTVVVTVTVRKAVQSKKVAPPSKIPAKKAVAKKGSIAPPMFAKKILTQKKEIKKQPKWNVLQYMRKGETQITGWGINRTIANDQLKAHMPLIKYLLGKEEENNRVKPEEVEMIVIQNGVMVEVYPSAGKRVSQYAWGDVEEKMMTKLVKELSWNVN